MRIKRPPQPIAIEGGTVSTLKKSIFSTAVFALAAVITVVDSGTVQAQGHGGGGGHLGGSYGRGGYGGYGGYGGGYGRGYGGYGYGRGYGYGGYGGWGWGWGWGGFGWGLGLGLGMGFYGSPYYDYYPPYPSYGYPYNPYYGLPPYPNYGTLPSPNTGFAGANPSGIPIPAVAQTGGVTRNDVSLMIHTPTDATVWINGVKSTQTGASRDFTSAGLVPGRSYTYEVRAQWTVSEGKTMDVERHIVVQAGERRVIDFTLPAP